MKFGLNLGKDKIVLVKKNRSKLKKK